MRHGMAKFRNCRIRLTGLLCLWAFLCPLLSAADWADSVSSSEFADCAALARENLTAILARRSPKEFAAPAAGPLHESSGVCLYVLQNGKLLASGDALDANLLSAFRLAAGKAVYNRTLDALDQSAVITALLGKAQPVRTVDTPFYAMQPGREGYRAEYNNKSGFISPLEPVLNGWDWKRTLLELARRTLGADNTPAAELVRTVADPGFKLSVFPAAVSVSAAKGVVAARLFAGEAGKSRVDAALLKQALLGAAEWYRNNQTPEGLFPDSVNLLGGKNTGGSEIVYTTLNVAALGELWRSLNQQESKVTGLRALDGIIINYYLENPAGGSGYIKGTEGISLGAAAGALWAISSLDAAAANQETAKVAGKLAAFMLSLRSPDASFAPWFQPPENREGSRVFPALAIYALLNWKPEEHAASLLASLEKYRQEYTSAPGAQPPFYAIPWLTLASAKVYGQTRRSAYADWVLSMNTALAGEWQKKHRIFSETRDATADAALIALSLSEALFLQKIISGGSGQAETIRLQLYRQTLISALRTLCAAQVQEGPENLLLPEPRKALGAFREAPGRLRSSLREMSLCTLALTRALQALDNSDYTSGQ